MSAKNGCYDRPPFKNKVMVQDGWYDMTDHYNNEAKSFRVTRMPKMVVIDNPNSKDCQFTMERPDFPACGGCVHQYIPEVQHVPV